jgi:hypothetical protein
MKRSRIFSTLCCCVFTLITTSSSAELIDRGGGLIYDSDQNLTWAQDARMFSGKWDDAMTWAEDLVLGGVDGWRLPTTTQFDDPTCSGDVRVSINPSYPLIYEHRLGCLGGEMELLTALYDPWNNDLFKYIDAEGNVQRYINRTRYWAAMHYRGGTDPCIYPDYGVPCTITTQEGGHVHFRWQWAFTGAGDIEEPYKTTLKKGNGRYAWAVHDGDVGAMSLAGDINFDNQVNLADYLLLTQFVLDMDDGPVPTTAQFNAGDMNLNNQLDAGDLLLLSRTILGLI